MLIKLWESFPRQLKEPFLKQTFLCNEIKMFAMFVKDKVIILF